MCSAKLKLCKWFFNVFWTLEFSFLGVILVKAAVAGAKNDATAAP